MSDQSDTPQEPEDKPKKQPKPWPPRAAGSTPAPVATATPATPPDTRASAPATEEISGGAGEAPAGEGASAGEKPRKQPKIWKGGTGAAAPAVSAPAAPPLAAPRAPATSASAVPAKTVAAAKPPAPVVEVPKRPEVIESEAKLMRRRRFAATCVFGFLATNLVMFARFFFPRVLFEPKTVFKIGYPSDFGFGVDTKFQKDYRIWVVRTSEGIFAIYARCTHLGCTPDWILSENKFKCPCHGSGYDSEGINFEGPAPRPMDRARVALDADGQIVVDTGKLYQWPKGARSEFHDPDAFLPV